MKLAVGSEVTLARDESFRGKPLPKGTRGRVVEETPGGSVRVAVEFAGVGVVQWPVEAASSTFVEGRDAARAAQPPPAGYRRPKAGELIQADWLGDAPERSWQGLIGTPVPSDTNVWYAPWPEDLRLIADNNWAVDRGTKTLVMRDVAPTQPELAVKAGQVLEAIAAHVESTKAPKAPQAPAVPSKMTLPEL